MSLAGTEFGIEKTDAPEDITSSRNELWRTIPTRVRQARCRSPPPRIGKTGVWFGGVRCEKEAERQKRWHPQLKDGMSQDDR